MKPPLRFLLILAVVALVGWIAINVFFGPPGFSAEYMAQYKPQHDHYLEVIKSTAYKRYVQRPALNGPDSPGAPADLAGNIQFVEAYVQMPEFIAEKRRIALYARLFEFFNASLVVIIAWHFGRKPLLRFLDAGIAELHRKMLEAEAARQTAEQRKRAAEEKMASLPQESRRIAAETQQRLDRELAELAVDNQRSLELMEADLADRCLELEKEAEHQVKQEMINAMIDEFEERYRRTLAKDTADIHAHHAELVEMFASDLESQA